MQATPTRKRKHVAKSSPAAVLNGITVPAVVTPIGPVSPSSPTPYQKTEEWRADVRTYMCRFRHCSRDRDSAASSNHANSNSAWNNNNKKKSNKKKKVIPPEADLVRLLHQLVTLKEGSSKDELEDDCHRLRDFIKAYGVERNFKGMTSENVVLLLPIVKHLKDGWRVNHDGGGNDYKGYAGTTLRSLDVTNDNGSHRVIEAVDALVDLCKESKFGRNTSFASKVLNMLGLEVPIYSSECKSFLRIPSQKSYAIFATKWMEEFEQVREIYEDEATKLLLDEDGGDSNKSNKLLEQELGSTWFAIRGFDQTMCRETERTGALKQEDLCSACRSKFGGGNTLWED